MNLEDVNLVYDLPIGTEIHVYNGGWTGIIFLKDNEKHLKVFDGTDKNIRKVTPDMKNHGLMGTVKYPRIYKRKII